MSDEDVMQAAGEWYLGVLTAVEGSFNELIPGLTPNSAEKLAPLFVAALARHGYMIERDETVSARESGL